MTFLSCTECRAYSLLTISLQIPRDATCLRYVGTLKDLSLVILVIHPTLDVAVLCIFSHSIPLD